MSGKTRVPSQNHEENVGRVVIVSSFIPAPGNIERFRLPAETRTGLNCTIHHGEATWKSSTLALKGAAVLGSLVTVETVFRQLRSTMLYFQVVILAAVVMLVYYCEFTDTFSPAEQGFICKDPALTKPDPGPEQDSRIQPVILYSVVGGLPVVLVSTTSIKFKLHHSLFPSFTKRLLFQHTIAEVREKEGKVLFFSWRSFLPGLD